MRHIARFVIAVIAGIGLAIVVVAGIQKLGHIVYPPPAGIDFGDPAAVREFVGDLPAAAMLFVLAAYLLGTFAGAWLACMIARRRRRIMAATVGVAVLSATVANLIAIPHPAWFAVAACLGIPAFTWLGWRLAASAQAGA